MVQFAKIVLFDFFSICVVIFSFLKLNRLNRFQKPKCKRFEHPIYYRECFWLGTDILTLQKKNDFFIESGLSRESKKYKSFKNKIVNWENLKARQLWNPIMSASKSWNHKLAKNASQYITSNWDFRRFGLQWNIQIIATS